MKAPFLIRAVAKRPRPVWERPMRKALLRAISRIYDDSRLATSWVGSVASLSQAASIRCLQDSALERNAGHRCFALVSVRGAYLAVVATRPHPGEAFRRERQRRCGRLRGLSSSTS